MTIHFTRDSVCMGDDCFDNSRDFTFADGDGIRAVLPILRRFLPSVAGNDVVWVLRNSAGEELLAYYTETDRAFYKGGGRTLADLCGGVPTLHFVYYTSPEKRRLRLEERGGLDEYDFWERTEAYFSAKEKE